VAVLTLFIRAARGLTDISRPPVIALVTHPYQLLQQLPDFVQGLFDLHNDTQAAK